MNDQGTQLQKLLELQWPPIAIAFRDAAPAGIGRIDAPSPAGCAYWRLAAEGRVFYTEASDHYNCPIGAHTHGIDLPEATAKELQGLVETMVGIRYIRPEEVAALPRRKEPFGVSIYGPLDALPYDPDVVLVRGNTRQLMLLAEAAQAAGIGANGAAMGRPTCAILPQALESGQAVSSYGCIGNRVYTGLGDEEGYYAIPGPKISEVVGMLTAVKEANRQLETFHRGRLGDETNVES